MSRCLRATWLIVARDSASRSSPKMKYTVSCRSDSEVTCRMIRFSSAVDVRIPNSELRAQHKSQSFGISNRVMSNRGRERA